jgi:hypothetical protein
LVELPGCLDVIAACACGWSEVYGLPLRAKVELLEHLQTASAQRDGSGEAT